MIQPRGNKLGNRPKYSVVARSLHLSIYLSIRKQDQGPVLIYMQIVSQR